MCRSAAQGGRRCSGSRSKSSTAGATSPAATPTGSTTAGSTGVPTREQADQLAAKIPADRKDAFGRPLSESDRRFYALRESGYTGPLDPDGYPDTTSRGADVLRHMAERDGEHVTW